MPEAEDRPAGSGEEGAGLRTMSALSGPETYRPLSPLALGGFVLAAGYAAVVAVCAAVALVHRAPLLLPWPLFLLPVGAAVLCWIGRSRIRSSEGTQGGARLVAWGLGLSAVFGLTYAAYYAAMYLALRQQALAFAAHWMDLLRRDDFTHAYRLTISPAYRPADDAGLREAVEIDFRDERPGTMTFNAFRQWELVHLFAQGRDQVHVEPLGVSWDLDRGYTAAITYRITAPDLTCDLLVTLNGRDPRGGGAEGRQWQVDLANTTLLWESLKLTPEGERRKGAVAAAGALAATWGQQLSAGNHEDAWLLTLPRGERAAASEPSARWRKCSFPTLAGTALLGAAGTADRERVVSRLTFGSADLVHAEEGLFWAPARNRSALVQAVREMFSRRRVSQLSVHAGRLPYWEEREGQVRVPLDGKLFVQGTTENYVIEVRLVLEASAAEAAASSLAWRVAALDLVSGRAVPR